MEYQQNGRDQNSQAPVSGNQDPKPPRSPSDLIVLWLTIITSICQISDFGWKIYEELNQPQSQSVRIIQRGCEIASTSISRSNSTGKEK